MLESRENLKPTLIALVIRGRTRVIGTELLVIFILSLALNVSQWELFFLSKMCQRIRWAFVFSFGIQKRGQKEEGGVAEEEESLPRSDGCKGRGWSQYCSVLMRTFLHALYLSVCLIPEAVQTWSKKPWSSLNQGNLTVRVCTSAQVLVVLTVTSCYRASGSRAGITKCDLLL